MSDSDKKNVENPFISKNIDSKNANFIYRTINNKKVVYSIYTFIDPKVLKISKYQPRNEYNLEELISSIRKEGIKEEIQVNEKGNGDLVIINGVRRTLSAIELGLKEVPIIIKKLSEKEEQENIIINNIEHKDYTPIELAKALKMYKEKWNITNVELGKKFFPYLSQEDSSSNNETGAITSASQKVGRYLKLLELPVEVKKLIDKGYSADKGYFLSLLKFDDEESQYPDWKEKRIKYQIELAKSGIPISLIKKRVKELVKEEKEIRQKIEREKEKKITLLDKYNQELIQNIDKFIQITNINYPQIDHYSKFKINELKEKKKEIVKEINKDRIERDTIDNKKEIIDLLKKLQYRLEKENELKKEIDINKIEAIQIKLEETIKKQINNNRRIEGEISTINIKWDNISRTYDTIQKIIIESKKEGISLFNKKDSESIAIS